jgi:hypothetical protein
VLRVGECNAERAASVGGENKWWTKGLSLIIIRAEEESNGSAEAKSTHG